MTTARFTTNDAVRRRRGRALTWFLTCVGLALCAAWLSPAVADPIPLDFMAPFMP